MTFCSSQQKLDLRSIYVATSLDRSVGSVHSPSHLRRSQAIASVSAELRTKYGSSRGDTENSMAYQTSSRLEALLTSYTP